MAALCDRSGPALGASSIADRIATLSADVWGADRAVHIVGGDASLLAVQQQLLQFAESSSPVLITGATGTGKELFARGLYVLSPRRKQLMISVNCAQYQDTQILASELFGHRRGCFTGAVVDRAGVFEEADRGVVFLDEVAELSLAAQAMLLRALSEGEIARVGENRARRVNVRVVAATARDLPAMVAAGTFRADLLYRLRYLRVSIPPVRARGGDWRLLAAHFLSRLNAQTDQRKSFSDEALAALGRHPWPGNVREIRCVVELAFFSTTGDLIDGPAVLSALDPVDDSAPAPAPVDPRPAPTPQPRAHDATDVYGALVIDKRCFWDAVYEPFMTRELSRREVAALVDRGLHEVGGSYKDLLTHFSIPQTDYPKFMDFLRHHRLKRSRRERAVQ